VALKAALAKVAQGRGVTLMVNRFGSVFPNSVANQGPRGRQTDRELSARNSTKHLI
jgi:hypothetical protein